jgi:hypothetical protein
VPFVDNLESAISSRNGRGDSSFLIDEAEFAKDAIGGNRFEMEIVNENVDFSFLYDVDLFPFISLFENPRPSRKRHSFRSICEDVAESHDWRRLGFLGPLVDKAIRPGNFQLSQQLSKVSQFGLAFEHRWTFSPPWGIEEQE